MPQWVKQWTKWPFQLQAGFTGSGLVTAQPGGGYTVADAIAGLPFSIDTPTPPTITSTAEVTPSTLSENKVIGRHCILTAGSYGDQTFNTQDQRFTLRDGAQLGRVSIGASAARLEFRGETPRAGLMGYIFFDVMNNPTDILFDGVTSDHVDLPWDRGNLIHGTRIAIINSWLRAREGALGSFPSTDSARVQHGIFANNILIGDPSVGQSGVSAATIRWQIPERLVFVDNRVVNLTEASGDTRHTFRIHGNAGGSTPADYCYVARNQFEGPGHQIRRDQGDGAHSEILNVWFEDNDQYTTVFQPINHGSSSDHYVTNFRIRNNRNYGNTGGWPTQPDGFSWTIEGNTSEAYQSPPAWSYR